MNPITIDIGLITPLFSFGAFNKGLARPEIRVPSIRGMLRWWAEALLQPCQVVDMFGGAGNPPVSSQFVLRVVDMEEHEGSELLLPHPCDHQSPKNSLRVGSRFTLAISQRSNGKPKKDAEFLHVIKAWLMMGALGGRSNRGAGSFSWEWEGFTMPRSCDDYARVAAGILQGSPLHAAVLPKEFTTAEEARKTASDTIAGDVGHNALGSASPRIPSPLKLRVIELPGPIGGTDKRYALAAVWDGRNRPQEGRIDLRLAIDELCRNTPQHGKKEIGELLRNSALYNWCCEK